MTDAVVEVKESAGDKALRLNRVKNASEAYAEYKTLHTDPLTDELPEGFIDWPTFRDQFLAEWTNNRIVVTEKEADAMFDQLVETAEQELEQIVETPTTEAPAPVIVLGEETAPVVADAPVAKKKAIRKPVAKKVAKKAVVVRKVAAKKKSAGKGKMDLARATFQKYSGKWSRQEILQRLVEVNGLSPAYAATAYQILKSE